MNRLNAVRRVGESDIVRRASELRRVSESNVVRQARQASVLEEVGEVVIFDRVIRPRELRIVDESQFQSRLASQAELDKYIDNLDSITIEYPIIMGAECNVSCKYLLLIYDQPSIDIHKLARINESATLVVVTKNRRYTYIAIINESVKYCHYNCFILNDVIPRIRSINREQWYQLRDYLISRHNGELLRIMKNEYRQYTLLDIKQASIINQFNRLQSTIIKGCQQYILSHSNNISIGIELMNEAINYDEYMKAVQIILKIQHIMSLLLRDIMINVDYHNLVNPIRCNSTCIIELVQSISQIPYYCDPFHYDIDRQVITREIDLCFTNILTKTKTLVERLINSR